MAVQPPRTPLALRSIALLEILKGLLVLAAACGILSMRHTDLHAATDAFLLRHGIDPETPYRRLAIESVAQASHHHVGELVLFAVAYALLRLAEGYGLWRGKHWAEWFAILSVGLYLPLELAHIARRPTVLNTGLMILNVALVLYLGRLLIRERARRHTGRAPAPTE
jgi:uncharacterized membrane protein (DUF2068 family)